jgi:hypothetical protein
MSPKASGLEEEAEMAGYTRKIHPATNFVFDKLAKLVPDAQVHASDEHGHEVEMMALVCIDPDGESHVYPVDDAGKQALVRILTGGIHLAEALSPELIQH